MTRAILRFHGDLDYFLAPPPSQDGVPYPLVPMGDGKVSVKHAVESLGVPHTEIDAIAANGRAVGFDYCLAPGDLIDVFAWLPKPDRVNLRPPLPRPVRFVLDTHLGRLAVYLRLLGFDALYDNDYTDARLAAISRQEQRVLVTRDRGLLKRRLVEFGCCVRATDPKQQLLALIRRYNLRGEIRPWRRCLRCNELLEPVAKAEVYDQLEPKTKRYFDDFHRCRGCRRVYWAGSHYERMQAFIDQVVAAAPA